MSHHQVVELDDEDDDFDILEEIVRKRASNVEMTSINKKTNRQPEKSDSHTMSTWQDVTQMRPAMGVPVFPATLREERSPFPVTPDMEFTGPGAFAVNGISANRDDIIEEAVDQEPVDALATATQIPEHENIEDSSLLENTGTDTTVPNHRSMKYWRQRLLFVLSLEANVVLLSVVVTLLVIMAVSLRGHDNSDTSQSTDTKVPSKFPGLAAMPTMEPPNFLDSLHLPDYTLEALENPRSPQSKAYEWLISNINNKTSTLNNLPKWRLKQRFSLATFYYSTRGGFWVKNGGWLEWETNECDWEQLYRHQESSPEVNCNEMGEIKALVFCIANNMDGTIPPEISFLGKSLQLLYLCRQQQLRGSIPTALGELTQLNELALTATGISGTIPRELGLMTNLGQLKLIQNNLLGSIPSELGKLYNMTIFRLSEAELTGSIPTEFYQWHKLEILGVMECPKLNTELVLSEIAESIQQVQSIMLIQRAHGDKMAIPSHLDKLTKLSDLALNDWNISGTIPSNFGDLTELILLDLENNSISGTFPQVLFKLTNMVHLNLGSNRLEGKLPLKIFAQLTHLRHLSLGDNQFSGTIPTEVGLLSSLMKLDIQNTELSGTLPTELLQLENLTSFVVTNTSLRGSIPESLCDRMHQQISGYFGGGKFHQKIEGPICQGTLLCGCDCDPCPVD
ncbi:Leucine Rich Repeat [Seminavis robusta]|uniref:Leucine Rich Repeat n=1 Tax=Seminavis robusta TaxID=568900 RepID=A0A9N8ET35_9STRA|nr:Leucine Rich Repeat [Seminavis robusta]|eukprot:Sro1798_g298240.1 Leucine Rich Repeat (680) ;mRNA; f:1340-3712